jgi:hypothetical protein
VLSAVSAVLPFRRVVKEWRSEKYKQIFDCTVFLEIFQSWCRVQLCLVHYFSMYTEVSKLKRLSNSRFGSITFLLRMAGIPFKMKKISTLYAIYMITVIICSCSTFIGMFVDVYMHRDELGRAMTNLRVSIPYTNLLFIYFYCRFVRTLVITVQIPETSVSIPQLHTLRKIKIIIINELQILCHKKGNCSLFQRYYFSQKKSATCFG